MSRLQPARGTADLLPNNMAKHRLVIEAARTAASRYGFQEMATPIFEFSEVGYYHHWRLHAFADL